MEQETASCAGLAQLFSSVEALKVADPREKSRDWMRELVRSSLPIGDNWRRKTGDSQITISIKGSTQSPHQYRSFQVPTSITSAPCLDLRRRSLEACSGMPTLNLKLCPCYRR